MLVASDGLLVGELEWGKEQGCEVRHHGGHDLLVVAAGVEAIEREVEKEEEVVGGEEEEVRGRKKRQVFGADSERTWNEEIT